MVASKGQRVIPERTLAFGYRFKFTNLDTALENLLSG
jgi:NAD dependent epimerase/dehydratase family enzyme